jgi:HEAT repeat protein
MAMFSRRKWMDLIENTCRPNHPVRARAVMADHPVVKVADLTGLPSNSRDEQGYYRGITMDLTLVA